ncbi:homologous recombination OB-fold protein isoform X2 [Chelonia mydas]|uniref:homologous recombination OB-fold protein isoform X2 n=1 Tax=Chelonia mydas TaxID=8469 RepID=UPI0018A1DED0|nr:homologous recombination OB-fold protein isoform X2 [Chelonia mydas]XP_043392800.1 homologous recombination OB-fold protein isoform X2 [Chelonia mydas]
MEGGLCAAAMACRLQKLFAVEEELEDEDFLSAVEDAENQFSDLVPVNSRCLRPFSSGPRDPGTLLAPAHESPLPALPSTSMLSPVFGPQNLPKLRVGADCPSSKTPGLRPRTVVNDQTVEPPAVGFKALKAAPTLAAPALRTSNRTRDCTPSSAAGFKFVSRQPPPLPEAPHDDEFENDLFLAACVQPGPGPAVAEKGMPPQVCRRDESSHGGTAFKKLRVGDPVVTPSPGGSVSLPHEGTRAISRGADRMQNLSPFQQADPALKLRLSTAGSCFSQSSLVAPARSLVNAVPQGSAAAGVSCDTISAPRCCTLRPFQASGGQPGTAASSPSVAPVKAPSLHSPGSGNPRPPAPQMPSQGCSTPRGPGSSWRPPLRLPTGPRSLMTCVESPTSTPRAPSSGSAAAGSLQTPVVTNHLVQLVTAANKTPRASGWTPSRVKSRRFPGPAGILPHQYGGKNLEEILISTPQTPAHGALAKLRTEEVPSSQQPIEEDFGKGPWIAMKTDLRLDERDPSCFLRTYSVAMVLRKAALKQLPKNKVPSMAVVIKSLTRTSVDAGAVFKDPTGEMQGTVHRLLLEERQSDLKAGSVLLLKQVGVFSPSHRNHYLNVTPNNLVKIYLPESGDGSPLQLSQEHGEMGDGTVTVSSEVHSPAEFQQDSPENLSGGASNPRSTGSSRRDGNSSWRTNPSLGGLLPCLGRHGDGTSGSNRPSQEEPLGAEACDMDDLDGLLGQLPEDFFSASAMESSW